MVKNGHGTFTAPVAGGATGSDAAVVSSMANAVSQLADSIASAVKETLAHARTREQDRQLHASADLLRLPPLRDSRWAGTGHGAVW